VAEFISWKGSFGFIVSGAGDGWGIWGGGGAATGGGGGSGGGGWGSCASIAGSLAIGAAGGAAGFPQLNVVLVYFCKNMWATYKITAIEINVSTD